jgi:hypothetical protein
MTANKLNKKSVSLYYDSGIGTDVVSSNNFSTTTSHNPKEDKLSKHHQTSSHHDLTSIKSLSTTKRISNKSAGTLNPSVIRKLSSNTTMSRVKANNNNNNINNNKSKLNSSSSTSESSSSTTTGTSSSSVGLSSSSIFSDRVRHKLDSMLKSNNLKIVSISKSQKASVGAQKTLVIIKKLKIFKIKNELY